MLLTLTDASHVFTEDDLALINRGYRGRYVSDARRKAASPMVRTLLYKFDTTEEGQYSDDDRRWQRHWIIEGFLSVSPYEFRESFYDHISKRRSRSASQETVRTNSHTSLTPDASCVWQMSRHIARRPRQHKCGRERWYIPARSNQPTGIDQRRLTLCSRTVE